MLFLQPFIFRFISFFGLTLIALLTLNAADSGPKTLISTPEQVGEDAILVNCNDEERLSAVLLLFTKMGARDMEMPFGQDVIYKVGADSESFMRKGIPAITIHGLTDDFGKVLHKRNDQPSIVIPDNAYLGYRLALSLVREINKSPCASFR